MGRRMPKDVRAGKGDRVAVHYTGSLDDGQVFDSSEGREPLEFTVGDGEVIHGFERAVEGLAMGEERTVSLAPHDGYGEYDPELVIEGAKDQFPADVRVGQSFHFHLKSDEEADGVIKEIRKDTVLVDFNHPLAGKRLTFHIKLVRVN